MSVWLDFWHFSDQFSFPPYFAKCSSGYCSWHHSWSDMDMPASPPHLSNMNQCNVEYWTWCYKVWQIELYVHRIKTPFLWEVLLTWTPCLWAILPSVGWLVRWSVCHCFLKTGSYTSMLLWDNLFFSVCKK